MDGIKKYVGRIVTMIYQDKSGQFTKRRIYVHSVRGERVVAWCQEKKEPRTFKIESILAMEPAALPEVRGVGVG